ncbi:phosphoesterase [Megavirus baoshan]|uniref:Putative phosphoesterase n=1 Tax=Megavirus baoshan TaxID=2496520 RepID=A0A3Q8U886_9VIRU|nr:phosphoesterase [Megavirus baoshan]AZL89360.1 phosphoesterase [Megavirus baoshan]
MHIKTKYKVKHEIYSPEDFMKDCPNNKFLPTILPPVKRIIAMGDIHGDLDLAIRCFKLAQLIDNNNEWIANPPDTIVIQVGDQIDSCRPVPGYDCHNTKQSDDLPNDILVMNFFDEMNIKASRYGGAVYSLLGNHELMNSQGKFDYVSYENFHNFIYNDNQGNILRGPKGRKDAFKPGGPVACHMACTRQSIITIGSTMFAHAGILPILSKKLDGLNLDSNTKLEYLNAVIRKWLLNKLSDQDKEYKTLFLNDTKTSPFWTRIYGSIPKNTNIDSDQCFISVKKTLQVFKMGQLVVGHTPQLSTSNSGINGTCYEKSGDNKLYRIDGAFAHAFKMFNPYGLAQVLEILDDNNFNIITESPDR